MGRGMARWSLGGHGGREGHGGRGGRRWASFFSLLGKSFPDLYSPICCTTKIGIFLETMVLDKQVWVNPTTKKKPPPRRPAGWSRPLPGGLWWERGDWGGGGTGRLHGGMGNLPNSGGGG